MKHLGLLILVWGVSNIQAMESGKELVPHRSPSPGQWATELRSPMTSPKLDEERKFLESLPLEEKATEIPSRIKKSSSLIGHFQSHRETIANTFHKSEHAVEAWQRTLKYIDTCIEYEKRRLAYMQEMQRKEEVHEIKKMHNRVNGQEWSRSVARLQSMMSELNDRRRNALVPPLDFYP